MARSVIVRPGNAALSISFEADISSIKSEMPEWAQRRIPSITRNALNDSVIDAAHAETDKIRGVFDRPKPLTERAPLYRKATSDSLTAWVFIRDEASGGTAPSKYLMPQVMGGARGAKRFEVALRSIGVMRADEFAIPAIGFKRDQHGNVPGSTIVRILSQLRAMERFAGSMANETAKSKVRNVRAGKARYFIPQTSGPRADRGISRLPRGIYERQGNRIRAVFVFVKQPTYRKRYDFGQAARAKVERVFWPYWQRHFYAELKKHTSR
ncbi:hypothetical protein [Devosia sp. Root635]|uniref:hypothetical protein n=1 Tax=Devosia sp. Root635 TaxID=1736575 RepID=UPI0006F366FC|nr:hypothetical protein [Devosia sp. Root635]KRA44686.1 hypothetical protein ASD80_05970 [Devosia sp. Root635]